MPQQIFCKVNSLFSLLFHYEYMAVGSGLTQGWYLLLGEPQKKWKAKTNRSEWWLIAGLHQSRMVHRSNICVLWGQREIVWYQDVLVTRKVACRPAATSLYLACCSSLVCSAELFAIFVDGDDLPALGLNGAIFQFLGSSMFTGAPWKL